MLLGQKGTNTRIKYRATLTLLGIILLAVWAYTQVTAKSAPPTVKIGLVAPFEGLYRSTGYEVLFAVKAAVQARNQGDGLHGYRVELVALNDFNDPAEAARQARALAADPDILGVVGHLTPASTIAAIPVYQQAQLAIAIPWSINANALDDARGMASVAATYEETVARLETISQEMGFNQVATLTDGDIDNIETLSEDAQALHLATDAVTAGNIILALQEANMLRPLFGHIDAGNLQLIQIAGPAANDFIFISPAPAAADLPDSATFIEAYQTLAGLPPGPRAVLAYDATNVLLDAIEQAIKQNEGWLDGRPGRAAVQSAITGVRRHGLSGDIAFSPDGRRLAAPVWVYQISELIYPGTLIYP